MLAALIKAYPTASMWTAGAALLGLVVTLMTAAVQIGNRNALIDQKVDKATYNADIGQIKGDIRVIKSAVCSKTPAACQQ